MTKESFPTKVRDRFGIFILICFFAIPANGQDTVYIEKPVKHPSSLFMPLYPYKMHLVERLDILYGKEAGKHLFTTAKPLLVDDIAEYPKGLEWKNTKDEFNFIYLTADYDFDLESEKPILKYFYRHPSHLYQVNTDEFQMAVNPIFHFEGGKESAEETINYFNSRGVEVYGNIARRVSFYTNIIESQAVVPEYVKDWILDHNQVFPGEGRTKPFKSQGWDFLAARGYIAVKPFKQLDIQLGQDKNFIGDGYRSLFLSDVSKDYFFLKLNTQVWKINYQNLFTQLIDYRAQNIADGYVPRKFATFHHLSIAPMKNLSIGLFEGVVYGDSDSTAREFEFHYLNPIIFYRAVEFQLGSSDNVVIGMDWKYNFLNHFSFYGQVVIDDMIYWEFLRGTGWWGNKYGLQTGLKYFDAFGISTLDLQAEFNTVSPYTYSHSNTAINYTHFSQPLAHPLGANFREFVGIIRYQPIKKLELNVRAIFANYGADLNFGNYGQDIFKNNSTRIRDYGNEIGQGFQARLRDIHILASYMIKYNIFFDAHLINRSLVFFFPKRDEIYFGVGLRMNMPQRDFSF